MNLQIRCGYDAMDFARVTEWLADMFWSPGIGIEEVRQGASHSAWIVGAVLTAEIQIGYARVISDRTRFAYILDVVVDPDYRGQGVGGVLMNAILEADELADVYQWMLVSSHAAEWYKRFGFERAGADAAVMIRHAPTTERRPPGS